MAKTNLNISVDENIKKQAQELFNELGIDISTAVNIFMRQSIRQGGIPFKIGCDMPNKETIEAIKEGDDLLKDNKSEVFHSVEELIEDLEK